MKKIVLLTMCLFILGSCDQAPPQTLNDQEESKEIVQTSNSDYKMMVPFEESSIRGIFVNGDSDTFIDYDNMEEDLLELTKEFLKPNELFYEPGQILDVEDVNVLLARESDENVRGLNPPKVKKIEDSALYVNTMIEQDFYTFDDENNKVMNTVAFGFGIDTTYEQDGKTVTVTDDKIKNFITQYVSSEMKLYLEEVKGIEDVNIICAFYKESTDSAFNGSYYTYGMIGKDEEKMKEVKVENVEYKAYPNYSVSDDDVNNSIITFTSNVGEYFENYTGVSAIGRYEDGVLKQLNIDLVVNFYSRVEIEAFSEYVKENVTSDMKNIESLEIDIILPSTEILGILEYNNGKLVVDYIKT